MKKYFFMLKYIFDNDILIVNDFDFYSNSHKKGR